MWQISYIDFTFFNCHKENTNYTKKHRPKKKRINNYIYIFLLGWAFPAFKKSAFSSISWSSPKYSLDVKVIFQKVKAELLQKSLRHLLQLSFKYLVFIFLPSAKKKMFNQVTVDTGVNMWLFIWEFNVTWKSPFLPSF